MDPELVDRIYECAFMPDQWPSAGADDDRAVLPVRDADGSATMVAHVVPIRLSARDIFVRCAGVLALTPLSAPNVPSLSIVQSLFDLTPAEAKVARDLAEGKTVADIASAAGASESTIRSHVRAVLEKTGCNRQTDVVALLAGLAATRLKPI
jgi:DNA-binding CsgD family transcriptional regulator